MVTRSEARRLKAIVRRERERERKRAAVRRCAEGLWFFVALSVFGAADLTERVMAGEPEAVLSVAGSVR